MDDRLARGARDGNVGTEFRRRPDLVRTLDVAPPVVGGRVRIVTIEGFDEQACGGTHVHSTAEIGRSSSAKARGMPSCRAR